MNQLTYTTTAKYLRWELQVSDGDVSDAGQKLLSSPGSDLHTVSAWKEGDSENSGLYTLFGLRNLVKY